MNEQKLYISFILYPFAFLLGIRWPLSKRLLLAITAFTPITTLEGGFHDTRVRDSLGRPAHVVGSSALTTEPDHDQEPVPVGAGVERPW